MIRPATIGAIRFGYGPAGAQDNGSAAALMAQLRAPDDIAARFAVAIFGEGYALGQHYRQSLRTSRKLAGATAKAKASRDAEKVAKAKSDLKQARLELRDAATVPLRAALARICETDAPFRERLTWFWAGHFAVARRAIWQAALPGSYVDEALRPNIAGSFADLLKAAVLHPMMLIYLDQVASIGPNSAAGKSRKLGLNENLARELLELHTLGVGGAYSQDDVRQLAEFLTGLSVSDTGEPEFRPRRAEPGSEHVLGRDWGGARPGMQDIEAFLDALALRPDTATHISRKLAVHFIADDPPADLVAAMQRAYLDSGGRLDRTYAVMLDHPAAWAANFEKARPPLEFIGAGLRAMGFGGEDLMAMKHGPLARLAINPLADLAQPFLQPGGPNGWPEEAGEWITAQGLAARIAWADQVSQMRRKVTMDPAGFMERALADAAGPDLHWAIDKAETKVDAVALVLASPEFNRR